MSHICSETSGSIDKVTISRCIYKFIAKSILLVLYSVEEKLNILYTLTDNMFIYILNKSVIVP